MKTIHLFFIACLALLLLSGCSDKKKEIEEIEQLHNSETNQPAYIKHR